MSMNMLNTLHEKFANFFKKHPLIAGYVFIISLYGIIGCLLLFLLIFLLVTGRPTIYEALFSLLQWRTMFLLILFSVLLYFMDKSKKGFE